MNLQEVRVRFKKKDIIFDYVQIDDEDYKIRRIESQSRFNNFIVFQLKTTKPYTSLLLSFDSEKLIFEITEIINSQKKSSGDVKKEKSVSKAVSKK